MALDGGCEVLEIIAMIGAGVIDLSFLERRRFAFALSEVNEAFELVGSRPGGFVNAVVLPSENSLVTA
ncbi:hypothetical protein ABZ725_37870 [Streptomyces sp. NPDC006872]|uniref:hypothetical protein n=1 Tax=Streptomyces sp. NPDC006872 TaxID=3155720 RepID=UPI0034056CA5